MNEIIMNEILMNEIIMNEILMNEMEDSLEKLGFEFFSCYKN